MEITIKILIMLATVIFMAAPILISCLRAKSDEDGVSSTRFRFLIFTIIYSLIVTVILLLINEAWLWFRSLALIEWIVKNLSVSNMTDYTVKVYTAVILNIAIGVLYLFIESFVHIGFKKFNVFKPKNEEKGFTKAQLFERNLLERFNTETWFFVAKVLLAFNSVISVIYAAMFLLYQIPAMFSASWIPYNFISALFEAGYVYPIITLLILWEMYFFLSGVKVLREKCPDLDVPDTLELKKSSYDIQSIDDDCKKAFQAYYACSLEQVKKEEDVGSAEHTDIAIGISKAMENDQRNGKAPKEVYLNCIDKMAETEKSLLFNGNFFSEFSMYFFRYISIILARGDNVIFVCNDDNQIDAAYDYINNGLSELAGIYAKDFSASDMQFDNTIWRAVKISGETDSIDETEIDDNSILVTTLSFLCSEDFEKNHTGFVHLLDTVVFIDALNTVNEYAKQLSILNTKLLHITKTNSLKAKNSSKNKDFKVRYMSRPVRYFCFDDTKTPGLDKVLKNMLSVEIETVDATEDLSGALVRCYNYDGVCNKDGEMELCHSVKTDEDLGVVMSMALECLKKSSNVTVFTDESIPYGNIAESIKANMHDLKMKITDENLRVNKYLYNPNDYSVIIAVDSQNNLPAALRKYTAMTTDKPSLLIIFSPPYMFRDYYVDNINEIWESYQILRIPVEEGTNQDIAQKILVKANAGGISEREILALAGRMRGFKKYVDENNINEILKGILSIYNIECNSQTGIYDYFEYNSYQDFDENGEYNPESRVFLRKQGMLYDVINGLDMITLVIGDKMMPLHIPKKRLTQNYIAGQNLVYNGEIYHIDSIDTRNGRIFADLATAGTNKEIYKYIQDRMYRIDCSAGAVEHVYTPKHVIIKSASDNIRVTEAYISVFRAPAEVVTKGYYEVKSHSFDANERKLRYQTIVDEENIILSKQTYRKYGKISNPTYSSEDIMSYSNRDTKLNANAKGLLAMSIRLSGDFGENAANTLSLASVMLNEIIHYMFPSVADSVVVCPAHNVNAECEDIDVLERQPKLEFISKETIGEGDFELLIIEDSDSDLGVVSVLMSAGDDVIKTLFTPVWKYLEWYAGKEKSQKDYLYFGLDHEPKCFDFESLRKLSKILADDGRRLKYKDFADLVEYEVCDFCNKRYVKGKGIVELEDGRHMCQECARSLVGNNKKSLKEHLDRAKMFLESTYGITLDDTYEFCFDSTVKIINTLKQNRNLLTRSSDTAHKSYIDGKKVYLEYSLPSANLSELIVRELTYVWQLKNLPNLSEDLARGHIALVSIQYLRFLNQTSLANARADYYESSNTVAGDGYRLLVGELLNNRKFRNNPFSYLLEETFGETGDRIRPPEPKTTPRGERYKAENADRLTDGDITYFYYSRLNDYDKKTYNDILFAIENHEDEVPVDGYTLDELSTISKAIRYDHPELFYYNNCALRSDGVAILHYGASMDEATAIKAKIDAIVPEYLADITEDMSAYDTALCLHAKIINSVDYDTIALEKERAESDTKEDVIDYLRTICGVFLDGKAVCEGYARALQYLLQKCGVECAECAGLLTKDGGGHAWNILKADGDYYYIDATWDDRSDTVQSVKNNDMGFNYFCITTDELLRTRDTSLCPIDMPRCTATKCNYYYHNNAVLETYDLSKIQAIACAAAEKNEPMFTFKCTTKKLFDLTMGKLFKDSNDGFTVISAAGKRNKNISADSYTYNYNSDIWTINVMFKYK